jgi:hypothetical protein
VVLLVFRLIGRARFLHLGISLPSLDGLNCRELLAVWAISALVANLAANEAGVGVLVNALFILCEGAVSG